MIDLGGEQWDKTGMFVPAPPGSARRRAQVSQCIKLNLIGEYKPRCCPCCSTRMCPFKDGELENELRRISELPATEACRVVD